MVKLESPVNNALVKYPDRRKDVLEAVREFADVTFQRRVWLNPKVAADQGVYFDFDLPFHTLFDDIPGMSDDPRSTIGEVLLDEKEALAIALLIEPLELLLSRYGPLMTAKQAIADAEWIRVVELAQSALKVLSASHTV